MFKRLIAIIVSTGLLAVSITGCEQSADSASVTKSYDVISSLRTYVSGAGFHVSSIKRGSNACHILPYSHCDNPNTGLTAILKSSTIENVKICRNVNEMLIKIMGKSLRAPLVPTEDPGITCVIDMHSGIQAFYWWRGRYQDMSVEATLSNSNLGNEHEAANKPYVLVISTRVGADPMNDPMGFNAEMIRYVGDLQKYRLAKGFKYFSSTSLKNSKATYDTSQIQVNPIVGKDGLVKKLDIHFILDNWMDQCVSLEPWNSKMMGMPDSGGSYDFYFVEKLADLNAFGQMVGSSDCSADGVSPMPGELTPSPTP